MDEEVLLEDADPFPHEGGESYAPFAEHDAPYGIAVVANCPFTQT